MNAPQVVAHRGSSADHPENSWAAFEAAVVDGADAIECDVQGTRDNVLVIRHDLHIGTRPVATLTYAEIGTLEPGPVLLADLLKWASRAEIDLLVEVKDPDLAIPIGAMVAASSWRKRTVIGSFHGPALAALTTHVPGVKTSLMIGAVITPDDLVRLATDYRADGVHLCWEARSPYPHRLLDAAAIQRLRRAGLAITLWHEERETELKALVALGPDAICTNVPALLRRIVDAHANMAVSDASAMNSV